MSYDTAVINATELSMFHEIHNIYLL